MAPTTSSPSPACWRSSPACIALAAGLLRLGFLANFISEPVLKGFIIGLALTIIIGQVPKIFGVEKADGDFFEQAWGVIRHLGDTHGRTLLVGLGSLAVVLALRRWLPMVPGSLVAVILGVAAVKLFDLDGKGVEIVGQIDSGLPRIGLPEGRSFSDYLTAVGAAAGIMLVGFAEGLGAAKTYAARAHYEVDPNRELIGLGAANLGAGLMTGMVVNGSLSKTAVNGSAGARSQVSGLAVAVFTVVTLLFLTALFEDLPEATLAAVVIAAVVELVDIGALRGFYGLYTRQLGRIYGRAARPDFIAAVAAMLGVLVFDTLPGLVIGIIVSLLLLLYRASRPHVAELGRVPGAPGPVRRCRPPPGERGRIGRCRAARRVGTVLRQRRRGAPGDPRSCRPSGHGRGGARCRGDGVRRRDRRADARGAGRASSSGAASAWCSPTTSVRSATSSRRTGSATLPSTRRSTPPSRPSVGQWRRRSADRVGVLCATAS